MTLPRQFRTFLVSCTLLACVTLQAAAQEPAKAIVKGVVRLARNDEPIAGVRVTLTSTTTAPATRPDAVIPPAAVATTDRNGEFALMGVDAGSYRFSAGMNGYVLYGSTFVVTAGQTKDDIVVRLMQTASISGHVSSQSGKPVAGLTVQLQRRIYNANGAVSFSTIATAQTNDLGDYRAYWVIPGRYFVTTKPGGGTGLLIEDFAANFDNATRRGVNDVPENYPQIFFPGVDDLSKAVAVDLTEGADIRGIDFTMPRPQGQYAIRGRVIDGRTGQAPAKATVNLGGSWSIRWWDGATGTFEITNLSPGRYSLTARVGDNTTLPGILGQTTGEPIAAATVTIVDSDVSNVILTITPPSVITGRITVEGQLPSTTPLERLRINFVPPASSGGAFSTAVAADATFKVNAPVDGEFRATVSNLPAGFFVKKALFNNLNVLDNPASISTAGTLEILISANTGQISGRVLNQQSKSAASIGVVLIPNQSRDRPELYKRTTVDSEGRFTISGIAPGEYRVFAWERIETNSYYDPEVMRRYEQQGTPVQLGEGSRENIEVKLIPEGLLQ